MNARLCHRSERSSLTADHSRWVFPVRCLVAVVALVAAASAVLAQNQPYHYFYSADMPPGTIGAAQLLRGGPRPGYFQPVEISGPQDTLIAMALDGVYESPQTGPARVALLVGNVYRLKVTNIQFHPGQEIFPSIEIIDRLYPPPGREAKFPIPIQLTREELERALRGQYVVRVIYLEDPSIALPARDDPQQQRYFEVGPSQDPLEVADALGRPIAILRIGSRVPDVDQESGRFLFDSPPWIQLPEWREPAGEDTADVATVGAASIVQDTAPPNGPCGPVYPPCGPCGPMYPLYPPSDLDTGCPNGLPCGGWTPPGIVCPWPVDEYLCDGGDQIPAARVRKDWRVDGLQLEDTIVHYDTANGETHVQPSNRVCVYAPRFAAVRKAFGVVQHDSHEQVAGVDTPLPLGGMDDVQIATTAVQPLQPGLNLGTLTPSAFRERTPPTGLENSQALTGAHGGLLPYEDFTLIQSGLMNNSEKARLAERSAAAVAWSHDTAVQVLLNEVELQEDVGLFEAQSLHVYSLEGKPRLQVCKVASRKEARPGETVEFTIRFDNLGDQVIGNVTVVDNLTTRLEYVENSQTCSLEANFSASNNEGESLMLRWEIVAPMKVGEGGVIRFQCRVR